MAFAQDVLTRIINVNFGGATWVLGDDVGQIWSGAVTGTTSAVFNVVFTIDTGFGGQCNGGSSALVGNSGSQTIAMVVGGYAHAYDHIDHGEPSGHYTIGMIIFSSDGMIWQTALSMISDIVKTTTVEKIIFDTADGKFYCLATRGIESGGTDQLCLSSIDGRTWIEIGTKSDFESHCKYKDEEGNGLANGEFGIDPSKKDSTETFPFGKVIEDGLLITKEDMSFCPVTFSGGTWGRANYTDADDGELEVSKDDGNNWSVVGFVRNDERSAIRALVAAPLKAVGSGG